MRACGSHGGVAPPGGRSAFVELFLASTPFSADPSHSFQNAPGSGSLKDASSEVVPGFHWYGYDAFEAVWVGSKDNGQPRAS